MLSVHISPCTSWVCLREVEPDNEAIQVKRRGKSRVRVDLRRRGKEREGGIYMGERERKGSTVCRRG